MDACAVDQRRLTTAEKLPAERLPEFDASEAGRRGDAHAYRPSAAAQSRCRRTRTTWMTSSPLSRLHEHRRVPRSAGRGAGLGGLRGVGESRAGLIGWGYSYAVVGENRRVRYFDDRAGER